MSQSKWGWRLTLKVYSTHLFQQDCNQCRWPWLVRILETHYSLREHWTLLNSALSNYRVVLRYLSWAAQSGGYTVLQVITSVADHPVGHNERKLKIGSKEDDKCEVTRCDMLWLSDNNNLSLDHLGVTQWRKCQCEPSLLFAVICWITTVLSLLYAVSTIKQIFQLQPKCIFTSFLVHLKVYRVLNTFDGNNKNKWCYWTILTCNWLVQSF